MAFEALSNKRKFYTENQCLHGNTLKKKSRSKKYKYEKLRNFSVTEK